MKKNTSFSFKKIRTKLYQQKSLGCIIPFLLLNNKSKWKQRAKQSWYQNGDMNTPFFHAWASHRKRINTIKKVSDKEGREGEKMEDIGAAFVNFYQNLFTT